MEGDPDAITLLKSLGIGLEDLAIASLVTGRWRAAAARLARRKTANAIVAIGPLRRFAAVQRDVGNRGQTGRSAGEAEPALWTQAV